jgi:Na+-transporting NADH:ubiquinone oxidoreductase subunit NqrC
MNFNNRKVKKAISTTIIVVLVLSMIVPILLSAIM